MCGPAAWILLTAQPVLDLDPKGDASNGWEMLASCWVEGLCECSCSAGGTACQATHSQHQSTCRHKGFPEPCVRERRHSHVCSMECWAAIRHTPNHGTACVQATRKGSTCRFRPRVDCAATATRTSPARMTVLEHTLRSLHCARTHSGLAYFRC